MGPTPETGTPIADNPMHDLMFVGNARCFHTMDWYRNAKRLYHPRPVLFATDLIDGEDYIKLATAEDDIVHLHNIDRFLPKKQSTFGNIWRNVVKTILVPFQVRRLKRIAKHSATQICHAHSTYYMVLCWLAGLPFIGTPQGSEVLVRPQRSILYKYFSVKCLLAAKHITVDSVSMQDGIMQLCGRRATIVQNGIDINAVLQYAGNQSTRTHVVSIRGLTPLYRIDEIVEARASSRTKPSLVFTYPFWEDGFKAEVLKRLEPDDQDQGRVMPKTRLYEILSSSLLAISIPVSDSSPRSVYEAIFCGCCVAVTYSSWIDALPDCMRARLFIVDLEDPLWLDKAMAFAELLTQEPYRPSTTALNLFDQTASLKTVANLFYGDSHS